MMTVSRIRERADAFWSVAGGRGLYGRPVDLERAVLAVLPIAIHRRPGLRASAFVEILGQASVPVSEVDRALRGCLFANVGVGLILVDADDSWDEQRWTIAHEVAHFLLHYADLRSRAIKTLGQSVIPVLDGTRPASRGELFSSSLRDVPLGPYRHAMSRTEGRPTGQAAAMETEAEDLGLALLVPPSSQRNSDDLAEEFGIPPAVAAMTKTGQRRTSSGILGLFGFHR